MISKITKTALRITDIIALCFLVPLFIGSLFTYRTLDFETLRESTFEAFANPVISTLLALILPAILFLSFRWLERIDERRRWIITYAVTGLCMVIIVILGHWWIVSNPFKPVADQEQVWKAASDIAAGRGPLQADLIYFQEYPQQKPMAIIMAVASKACSSDLIVYEHFNLFFILAAVVMIVLCVKEVSGSPGASALTAILLTAFIPFTLYSKFIYGSVPGIFFTILAGYGLIKFFKSGPSWWLLLPVISIPLAVLLYQSELIFLIAAVIVIILGGIIAFKEKKIRILCIVVACSIVVLTVLMSHGSEILFEKNLGTIEEGGDGIPPSGHMLMGLMAVDDNMPGNYNGESQRIYEDSGYDTKTADQISRQKIAEAIKCFLTGERSAKFFLMKTECQWLDPWFGGLTMNVYDAEYRGAYDDEKWDGLLFGKIPAAIQKYLRIVMIMIYGGAIFCLLYRLGRNDICPAAYLPSIYFIGGFIFQFLWEQKSRYCLPYYIALFPMAAFGIVYSSCKLSRTSSEWSRRKAIYVSICSLTCIILLLAASLSRSHDFSGKMISVADADIYKTVDMQLPKGDYGIVLQYNSNEDMEILLYLDRGGDGYPVELSGSQTELEIPAYMNGYKDHVHFEIDPEHVKNMDVNNIHVYSPKILYLDSIFLAIIISCWIFMAYRLFEPSRFDLLDTKEKRYIRLLFAAAIFIVPISIVIGYRIHIPVLCRLFRVSAWFSLFLVLSGLYFIIVLATYGRHFMSYPKDESP